MTSVLRILGFNASAIRSKESGLLFPAAAVAVNKLLITTRDTGRPVLSAREHSR